VTAARARWRNHPHSVGEAGDDNPGDHDEASDDRVPADRLRAVGGALERPAAVRNVVAGRGAAWSVFARTPLP
jgi:hypothetical protein